MPIQAEWIRTVAPTTEPLTLTEIKAQVVAHQSDDDTILAAYGVVAREEAEGYMNRALFTQTWKLEQSDWADEMRLPMAAPLQSVSSVQYYDAAGTLAALASSAYIVDTTAIPGRVLRAPNQVWPALQADRAMRVVITYVCGWSAAAQIPERIKQGLRVHITASDMDRAGAESEASFAAARALWAPMRVYWRPPC